MIQNSVLSKFALKYIWWKTPEEATLFPDRIIAQVMNIGDFTDVEILFKQVPSEYLKKIVLNAGAGEFTERSWHYWHYRLNISTLDQVPPLPVRKIA